MHQIDYLTLREIIRNMMEEGSHDDQSVLYRLAELNTRALALFIDLVIISVIALIAYGVGMAFLGYSGSNSENLFIPIYLLLFFLASSYFVILNGSTGKTIGKMIMGIRIISDDGGSIGFWRSFVRWIGYYVSAIFLFIGFLWSFFDQNSQAWHDKLAGTFVVKE